MTKGRSRSVRNSARKKTRNLRPAQDSDDEDDAPDVGAEDRDHEQCEEEPRHDLKDLGDAHQHVVDPAAVVAGDRPDDDPDGDRHRDGEEPDHERDAGAVENAGQYVAAEVVRAEPWAAPGGTTVRR